MLTINLNKISLKLLPDGEPLFSLPGTGPNTIAHLECSITSPTRLFILQQACEILGHNGTFIQSLYIPYLMGQRMDRRIDDYHSLTLRVVSEIINDLSIPQVKVFAPHSDTVLACIADSQEDIRTLKTLYNNAAKTADTIVLPDLGMGKRWFNTIAHDLYYFEHLKDKNVVIADKKRDMQTGKLSGFRIIEGKPHGTCVILDDLCDGGGTFIGLAKVLRESPEVTSVNLAVAHGIFSKGLSLDGIDEIWTTNSYQNFSHGVKGLHVQSCF